MKRELLSGVCAAAALVFCAVRADAQTITVAGGYAQLEFAHKFGPMLLVSPDRGMSLESSLGIDSSYEAPFETCDLPDRCRPGYTLSLQSMGDGGEARGVGTLDGVLVSNMGGLDSPNNWSGRFVGSITLPAWAPHTTASAPFTFSGTFSTANERLTLAGNGTATVYLDENPNFPGSWLLSRLLFRFNQDLPNLWTSFDVGLVGQQGGADYSGGVFNVTGSGDNVWGTEDGFQYVFPADGASQLTARVLSMQDTDQFAKAGLMARANLAGDSAHVILDVNPNGNVEFNTRPSQGAETTYLGGTQAAFPVWLRLSESGTGTSFTVTASVSQDGQGWTEIGHVTAGTACCGFLGLVVNSRNNAVSNNAFFDNVSTSAISTPAQLPSPWQQSDVGQTGLAGAASFSNGTFTVAGAGADIWDTTDAFQYVYQPGGATETITAHVLSLQNTNQFAKAGVMLRDGLDPSSAHVILDETPTGFIEFMTRPSAGQSTSLVASTNHAAPVWLRLTRGNGSISGATSSDGAAWTTIGSIPDTLAASGLEGLIVTSHDTSQTNTATFDNVSVAASTTPPPPPPQNTDIVIYGSDVQASALHGDWTSASDGSSPNGTKLQSRDDGASTTGSALANPTNYFDVTFNAAAGVPYRIWLRLEASANSKFNDSVWLQFSDAQISGTAAYPIGTTNGLLVNLATDSSASSLSNWGWQNSAYWLSQPTTVTFPTDGPHTLRVQIREDGVALDQIVLSPSRYLSSSPGGVTNDSTIVPKS